MLGPRIRSCPDFSPCNNSTARGAINGPPPLPPSNPFSELFGKRRDSTGSWSLTSFMAAIPSSPSPKCSSFSPITELPCSPSSDVFYSQISPSVFSTPRHKSSGWFNEADKVSPSSSEEADEEIPQESVKEESNQTPSRCLSYCTEYKSFDTTYCQPLAAPPQLLQLPALADSEGEGVKGEEIEESRDDDVLSGSNKESEITEGSSVNGHRRLIARPKPYQAFLEEIKKKEDEEKVIAWKEAEHQKLMDKLKRKEAVINAWELKQTKKATMKMKKLEFKLERKRAKAMNKMQKKLSNTQRKAEEKKAKERRWALGKISTISRVNKKFESVRDHACLKFLCFF